MERLKTAENAAKRFLTAKTAKKMINNCSEGVPLPEKSLRRQKMKLYITAEDAEKRWSI